MSTISSDSLPLVERTKIGGSLEIPRIINGLWQLAGGHDADVDVESAANAIGPLIDHGLSAFDMADHYGDAELVVGAHITASASARPITAFTKWCPAENGIKSLANAEAAVDRALARMKQSQIALMQYHIWDYSDDTYLCNLAHLRSLQEQGKILHVGLTNTNAAHLELLIHSGYRIATNQVSCSLLDQRLVQGRLGKLCAENNVGILAYGTLLGGFLSEKWVDAPEPMEMSPLNWSLRKYLRFIQAAGGWQAFQHLLKAAEAVAKKHNVPISAVATRWVLDIPVVKAVIVGSRLSSDSEKYAKSNLATFSFSLDDEDRDLISEAQSGLTDIPGDCGDEYRQPPYLTAAGDLSDHIKETAELRNVEQAIAKGHRVEYRSGSKWEPIAGYCRAVRVGDTIRVSGTTANPPPELQSQLTVIGGTCPRCQTVAVLDIIARALKKLGSSMSDVVRTRVMISREENVQGVSEAHGSAFKCHGIRPSNTLTCAGLIGSEMLVEIEAEAVIRCGKSVTVLD